MFLALNFLLISGTFWGLGLLCIEMNVMIIKRIVICDILINKIVCF